MKIDHAGLDDRALVVGCDRDDPPHLRRDHQYAVRMRQRTAGQAGA
jgi:hypothetical protein